MLPATPTRRQAGVLAFVALLAIATAGPLAAAQTADEPAFVVVLDDDGSADITLRVTFDLATDEERQAFETLQEDEEARQAARDRFLSRLRAVANQAGNDTGRDMRVTDATVELSTSSDGETGIVELTASWSGLAAVEDDTLVLTEPFASGFSPERPFVLRAPDGYEIASARPSPDQQSASSATWQSGTELSGLSVELTPTDGGGAQSGGQPGFGPLAAIAALLAAAAGAVARRRER